ncbi:immunity 26/phosphotriesterase HocA family protein [Paenibacillus sp. LHD-117]|uniref:immunity 26/phosphotriesterase HocA family protein n=1 Tax=Paenibacillus sp. LHD-117 TaxID=3071412 RepID=UPI0027E0B12A|nr:immunity 26/phosphotriesterase HocA family protein [Paenibacillus sp. LHD-117]MDQ6421274.1 immunity 26/phosphotriesterase HocA family protein [Paenibacillus sp. LHD-117]
MKINLADVKQLEYLSFRLTNEQRQYFGLDGIEDDWDEVEIKTGTIVFYQGDVIRKVIHFDLFRTFTYKEYDTELFTNSRQFILPKSSKGKEKKMTPSNILSFMPTGCTFYVSLTSNGGNKSMVRAYNIRNNIELPIDNDENLNHVSELESWIHDYMNTCPNGYFDKVNKMRETPHRTIKYSTGDVFRFEIDREHYGFGLIIGEVKKLRERAPKNHPWKFLMTVPILIRIFEIKTKDKDLSFKDLFSHRLLRADIMSDAELIWGTHEIIGNKKLAEDDIDFTLHLECISDDNHRLVYRFAWGYGIKEIDHRSDDSELMEKVHEQLYSNSGVALSLPKYQLTNVLNNQPQFTESVDLLHPYNSSLFKKVFEWFGFSLDMDMDQFNRENNGLTREQYLSFSASYK